MILTREEHVSQGRSILSKPSLEGTCRKIRSPPLFPDMQDAVDTENGIHRKTHRKQDAEIVGKRRDPNTVLKPVKPTTDPRFKKIYQPSTIDPRTTNMESQIESRLSKERAKPKITNR
ncbi:hypothetical protein HID58_005303 [Brassica napus]|uniref:Uncharacterized protein n=2 Tax=Brassica TaxID=3705 RepID=A0ABQ8E873_BRANA|nr:hypothetical protein HID58_005303 [Brassica napus]